MTTSQIITSINLQLPLCDQDTKDYFKDLILDIQQGGEIEAFTVGHNIGNNPTTETPTLSNIHLIRFDEDIRLEVQENLMKTLYCDYLGEGIDSLQFISDCTLIIQGSY